MTQSAILIIKNGIYKGQSFPLLEKNTLGRDPSNTITLPDSHLSRNHCEIWIKGDTYRIRDLDSKNGTQVNNLLIREKPLKSGDIITLGNTLFAFQEKCEKYFEDVFLMPPDPKQTLILHKLPREAIKALGADSISELIHEKTIKNLSVLYHIGLSIYIIRDIDKLLNRVLELIFKAIPVERGVILLYDKTSSSLRPRAKHLKDEKSKELINISSTIVNQSFNDNVALITKDALIDERFKTKDSVVIESIRSAICVPIGTQEKNMGVIYLDTKTRTVEFNENTLKLITAISNQMAIAIENITFRNELETEANTLKKELKQAYNMVGISPQMKEVFHMISQVAPTNSNVLITGESGTGKELVARAIHYNSPRSKKPLIVLNCTAITETLIESELFGHEKGAFTGAHATKPGLFELASGGTLFLDEIGEMPLSSQTKLLRVLEENIIRHVGGTKNIPVDTRVLAASNRDLNAAVKEGTFRDDLYYRLKVIHIDIEPLRKRKEDIPLLAQYFLTKLRSMSPTPVKGFTPEAIKFMEEYSWPGNIRQLRNSIERAMVMKKHDYIGLEDLDILSTSTDTTTTETEEGKPPSIAKMERTHIIKTLQFAGGNKTKTAEMLGIRRSTLYEKIKAYNIEDSEMS